MNRRFPISEAFRPVRMPLVENGRMVDRKHRVGEVGEATFVYRATQLGLKVAKPMSGKESYDYILDNRPRCWKVQVKTTETLASKLSYRVNCGKGATQKEAYAEGEIDFLVIHVIPEDAFYILPWEALEGRVGLIVPSLRRKDLGAFAQHLGRWDLLTSARRKRWTALPQLER